MKQKNFCSYEVLFWLYIQVRWKNPITYLNSYRCPTRVQGMTPQLMERSVVKQYHYFGELKKNTVVMHNTGKKLLPVWLECPEKEWEKEGVGKVSVMAL